MRAPFIGRTDATLVGWTLLAKVAVLALGFAALWAAAGEMPASLLEPWHRWDAPHYTDIAIWGYVAHDPGDLSYPGYVQDFPGDLDLYIVFFPLFPWLTSAVLAVVGDPPLAAFIVATAASLFVAPMLYRLVREDLGHRIGLRAVAFMIVFPTAFFLHIGYTESLFLALAFGSMWLARTERWWAAGVVAGLATLARVNGLVLIPTLAIEAYLQWRRDRRPRVEWLAIGGAAIGFGAYLLLNWSVYGDPLMFSRIQGNHWFKDLSPPWEGIGVAIGWLGAVNPDDAFMNGWMELLFTGLGAAAAIGTAIWLRPSWGAWMIGNWLLFTGTGFLLSTPRYSLALFGLFVWAAFLLERRRWAGWLLGAASATAMALFAWRFAVAAWAF